MRSNMLLKIFAVIFIVPLLVLIFSGCSGRSAEDSGSPQAVTSTPAESSEPSLEAVSLPEESEPAGEPTFLIGLDGNAILTNEITRLEDTDKTAETLTEDDLWADIYCDGFTYLKEPCGVGYSQYKNPELFDENSFIGEAPEIKNEWKRVNVGDEICGFKGMSATTHFAVNDWEDHKFPARYYYTRENFCELEGTVELEGYLQVTSRSVQYPTSGELLIFYPCESKLPLMPCNEVDDEKGFQTVFGTHCIYNNFDILYANESGDITLGYYNDAACDLDGLGVGDVAYARVTLGNLGLFNGGIGATLENVELLSDILAHNEDDTEIYQPAPVL